MPQKQGSVFEIAQKKFAHEKEIVDSVVFILFLLILKCWEKKLQAKNNSLHPLFFYFSFCRSEANMSDSLEPKGR